MTNAITSFEVGKTYFCRSHFDSDRLFQFTILDRTETTVSIVYQGKKVNRKIGIAGSVEFIQAHGQYSLAPVLSADSVMKPVDRNIFH